MIFYVIAAIVALVVYFKYIRQPPAEYEIISKFYGDQYWCKGEKVEDDISVQPFKIRISDEELEDLNKRIDSTRYPTQALEEAKFSYGVNQKFMREFVDYWRNSYSWRKQEEEMNKLPHFKTNIEGLDIHFVHVKPTTVSKDNKAKPLLLCHGWPGSFHEFNKIIPMLTDPTSHGGNENDLFELIIPSIPGYGFSQAPELKGFSSMHCARIFNKLMQRLGHKKYYLQGGDWGALITTNMSMLYPSSVKGVHTNMTVSQPPPLEYIRMFIGSLAPNWFYNSFDANKMFPLKKVFGNLLMETGYMHIQATKPDTVGFALTDSPVGLAAYIVEKFSTWTNVDGREKNDGGLWKYWTKDELLDNIMIYWWSRNITSSMRFYKESIGNANAIASIKVRVPAAFACFPDELFGAVKETVEHQFTRLVSFTYMKEGGHFAAFQVPSLLAEDFRNFVRKVEMLFYIITAVVTLVVYFKYIRRKPDHHEILSTYYGDKCWTKQDEVIDTSIRRFKIDIDEKDLDDLNKRIASTRYPTPALEDSKFMYGVNQEFMREFVDYWRNSYSWRKQENELNKFSHFKTKIEGLDIHFVHFKPKTMTINNQPRPLLLCSGWPGSFYEFYKIIPMLTDPSTHGGNETDLFEVIVPSIPGYGFSQAPEKQGFNTLHCARIFHKLMQRLGHKKYYLQGGDWGAPICMHMSMLYPSEVKGVHTSMVSSGASFIQNMRILVGSLAPKLFFNSYESGKWFPLKDTFKMFLEEFGYFHIQATKPDTIGFALSDSPVGLAAYILEKFSSWTDMDGREKIDGGLWKYWTKDEMLNNIMIYWWSGNITSSMRMYKEALGDAKITKGIKVHVPAGYAWFPGELYGVLKESMKEKCTRLISFTYMKEGGHFGAFQVPHLLVEDFREFVRKIESVDQKEKRDEMEYAKQYQQTHLDRFEKI